MKKKIAGVVGVLLVGTNLVLPLSNIKTTKVSAETESSNTDTYKQRFLELYEDINDPSNGYYSKDGLPYHSIETLIVEAPDQGHESVSETVSYYAWLEAMKGRMTGDFSGLKTAWDVIEKYYIPTDADQPGQGGYNPSSPATYAAEHSLPDGYPSKLEFDATEGSDPIGNELKNAYGTNKVYGMHWIVDADNFYGFGRRGDGTSTPSYINTFQRGRQESTWETIPQPSWEDFTWGGEYGFLPFFTQDNSYSKQWRYTDAPDADARLVQVMYEAKKWADEQGVNVDTYVDKATKMGDYLRYAMFDKYFGKIGTQDLTPGNGYDSCHYLMSWYYAWGGAIDADWAWRIGCSHCHFGYQNPMAAYALSTDPEMQPKSTNGKRDWGDSLERQLEFYQWLQSSEGAIAGGATNSYEGAYEKYPSGTNTFYGMAYDPHPVYSDPGSNTWMGWQAWSMQRVAEYYYETGDQEVKELLDKWVDWVVSVVKINADGTFAIPGELSWSGQPDTWTGESTGNKDLHCKVVSWGQDLGVTASLANALTYYAAAVKEHTPSEDYKTAYNLATELLDRMWNLYRDDKGVAAPEIRSDYKRFFEQEVYVPSNYTGKMASGDEIVPGVTFFELRSQYKDDPDFARLEKAYKAGEDFEITYHRYWAQAEIAIANATVAMLFEDSTPDPTPTVKPTATPVPTVRPTATPTVKPTATPVPTVKPTATPVPTVRPTATPVPTQRPTATPVPTVRPTATPVPTQRPTATPVPTQRPTATPVPTQSPTATPVPTQIPQQNDSVKVSFRPQGQQNSNTLLGNFTVTTKDSLDLSKLVLRYYFTVEGELSQNAFVDNAQINMSRSPWYMNLTGKTTATIVQVSGNQFYVDIAVNADQIMQAGDEVGIGVRVSKKDWSQYDQSNDYSYTNGVVVLYNNQIISGRAPY